MPCESVTRFNNGEVKVRMDIPTDTRHEMWFWCRKTFVSGTWGQHYGFDGNITSFNFKREEDATFFILRWASEFQNDNEHTTE